MTYIRLTAAAPEWAEGASLAVDDSNVYFELNVIASSPVANLSIEDVAVEAGELPRPQQNAIARCMTGC